MSTKSDNIKTEINNDNIRQSIIINANQMVDLNGKIDTLSLINKTYFYKNPIRQYIDDKGTLYWFNNNDNKDYWIKEISKYTKYLNDLLKTDISSIDAEGLKQLATDFNKNFLKNYIGGISANVVDLIGKKESYASYLASSLVDIQANEINKIGLSEFIKLDLKKDKKLNKYMSLDILSAVQNSLKNLNLKKDNIYNLDLLNEMLYTNQIADSLEQVNERIELDKAYYTKINNKLNKINSLITAVVNKYKARDSELTENSQDAIIIEQTNTSDIVKKSNIKLPSTYNIDFDIMKLFNNIYPNYKYKSIDDDRHKDIDIKAKLMLDIDSDTTDANVMFQNMRLVEFINNGYLQLFPIQSALINGFIDIRDNQDTMDKIIPFQSTLKYITEDKKLRFPKSKKDIQLYEDFMLFFDRCKIQVKIIDRTTSDVIFEVMQPIPLLSNTQAYSNKSGMGYIVGNSIINILKNELDNLHTTPHQTTLKASKGYLQSKLPNTPATINLTQHIYSKIATMINSYNKKGTYQSKINLNPVYEFQAFYNKHPKPTKDDKDKVREMLNTYLNSLINKGLLEGYEPIKNGKEINQYKIKLKKGVSLKK